MTKTTPASRAARALQKRTGKPYQRLLQLTSAFYDIPDEEEGLPRAEVTGWVRPLGRLGA